MDWKHSDHHSWLLIAAAASMSWGGLLGGVQPQGYLELWFIFILHGNISSHEYPQIDEAYRDFFPFAYKSLSTWHVEKNFYNQ